jgi:competence protein ComEA
MRSTIKNYLSVTKKEWNGMVVLIILIALILSAPYLFQLFRKDTTINAKDFNNALAILDKAKKITRG